MILLTTSFWYTCLDGLSISLFLILANPANNPKYQIFFYSNVLTKLLTNSILLFGDVVLNFKLSFRKLNSLPNIAYSSSNHQDLHLIPNCIVKSCSSMQTLGMIGMLGTLYSLILISSSTSIFSSYSSS